MFPSLSSEPLIAAGNLNRYQYLPSGDTLVGVVALVKSARVPETSSVLFGTARIFEPAGCFPRYLARSCACVENGPFKRAFASVVFFVVLLPLTIGCVTCSFGP